MRLTRFTWQADPLPYERKVFPGGEWMEHLGGTEWLDAARPPWFHRCWPQTRGWVNRELVERCACGSLRFDGWGPWVRRNERKRSARQLTIVQASLAAVAAMAITCAVLLVILGLVP